MGLVWECSKRQTCSDHRQEWNSLWLSIVGTTYLRTLTAQSFCMAREVSCSWWSTLEVCVCGCFCWYFLVIKLSLSHCSGLSNTESGSTEIFSFFSGQLYSLGNFVYTKRNDIQSKTGKPLNKTNQKLKYKLLFFTCLLTSAKFLYIPKHLLHKLFSQ